MCRPYLHQCSYCAFYHSVKRNNKLGPESNQMLQRMLAFAAVVESGSFTMAAEKLGLAKSSISKQIRALELDFGVRLLHRESRKLVLTEEGRAIRPHCEQLAISARLALG